MLTVRQVERRRPLIDEHGLDKAWVKAAGYWKRGAVSIHETHND